MALLSVDAIAVIAAILILVTVLAAVTTLEVRNTPVNAAVAGAVAGVSGTATSIGGPFLALVLRHERPERLRATMAMFFLIGATMSIVSLAAVGEFSRTQVVAGLAWVPFILLGYAVASPLRARLHHDTLRRAVLWFCVIAGVSILVRAAIF